MFFNKQEIIKKAKNLYSSSKVFRSYMENEDIFPYSIKLKRLKQSDIIKGYNLLLKSVDELKSLGLHLNYQEFNFKMIGVQKLPVEIVIETRDELLNFIAKKREFESFVKNYEIITLKFPSLRNLFLSKPKLVIDNLGNWDRLLRVCTFFILNPKPKIYIRELYIKGVDTKFIEKNRSILDMLLSSLLDKDSFDETILNLGNDGFEKKYHLKYPLPTVRFRILDNKLKIANLSDISLPINEFEKLNLACKNIFIVENKITTLSFMDIDDSIVIFGSGYSVGTLKNVEWFKNKNIYYWGDIDKDGFAILSQARGYFKQIKSILMNEEVINLFKKFSVEDLKNQNSFKRLDNLTVDEQKVYQKIEDNFYGDNFRLEQERVAFDYVKENILKLQN